MNKVPIAACLSEDAYRLIEMCGCLCHRRNLQALLRTLLTKLLRLVWIYRNISSIVFPVIFNKISLEVCNRSGCYFDKAIFY